MGMVKAIAILMGAYAAVAAVLFFAAMALAARIGDGGAAAPPVATAPPPAASLTPTPTAAPVPTPTPTFAVPSGAVEITTDATWPATETIGGRPAERRFYSLRCDVDRLAVSTTRDTFVAEVDCGKYWLADDVVRPFLAKRVVVRFTTAPSRTLAFDAEGAGVMRFSVTRVWRVAN